MIGELLGGISLSTIVTVVSVLGLPGLVLIFWYVDQRRLDQERKEHQENLAKAEARHKEEMAAILARYDKDMATVTRFYEDNVVLVKAYEKVSGDLAGIIHMNTQVNTKLVEKISTNMFCPLVREKGPHS